MSSTTSHNTKREAPREREVYTHCVHKEEREREKKKKRAKAWPTARVIREAYQHGSNIRHTHTLCVKLYTLLPPHPSRSSLCVSFEFCVCTKGSPLYVQVSIHQPFLLCTQRERENFSELDILPSSSSRPLYTGTLAHGAPSSVSY